MMKILIVEDDFATRKLMLAHLTHVGECDVAVNGREAIKAFAAALNSGSPYHLICLDISMPEQDGQQTLQQIRALEEQKGFDLASEQSVKVIMTTAFDDNHNILSAFRQGCESYLVKPVNRQKLFAEIAKVGLLVEETT